MHQYTLRLARLLPGRIDFSVPGCHTDFSAFERSSLTREKRTTEVFVKSHITFKGARKRNPEGFLANLTRCKETYELNLDEIIKALSLVLDDVAWQWFRSECQFWKSYEDLVETFCLQYSFEDVQEMVRYYNYLLIKQVRKFYLNFSIHTF